MSRARSPVPWSPFLVLCARALPEPRGSNLAHRSLTVPAKGRELNARELLMCVFNQPMYASVEANDEEVGSPARPA